MKNPDIIQHVKNQLDSLNHVIGKTGKMPPENIKGMERTLNHIEERMKGFSLFLETSIRKCLLQLQPEPESKSDNHSENENQPNNQ